MQQHDAPAYDDMMTSEETYVVLGYNTTVTNDRKINYLLPVKSADTDTKFVSMDFYSKATGNSRSGMVDPKIPSGNSREFQQTMSYFLIR